MTGMVFSRVGCGKLRVNIACDKPCVGVEISLFRDFRPSSRKDTAFLDRSCVCLNSYDLHNTYLQSFD